MRTPTSVRVRGLMPALSPAEQGYAYTIVDADDVLGPPLPQID